MFARIFIALLLFSISGCASTHRIVLQQDLKPLAVEQVTLFYADLPDCDFSVVGIIQIPGEFYSQAGLLRAFRHHAAQLGANAVHVHYLRKIGSSEFMGQGRALKCQRLELREGYEAMI